MTDNESKQVVDDLLSPEFATQVAKSIRAIATQRAIYKSSLKKGQRLYAHPSDSFFHLTEEEVASEVTKVLQKQSALSSNLRKYIKDSCTAQLEQNKRDRDNQKLADENNAKGLEYISSLDESYKDVDGCKLLTVTDPGDSVAITEDSEVVLSYSGKLLDGTEFDSSPNAKFKPSQLVPGFRSCLLASLEGGVYTYVIPSSLAYGDKPQGSIPPGSTLIFDVTILEVH